jgi:RHS repeat-associated protein
MRVRRVSACILLLLAVLTLLPGASRTLSADPVLPVVLGQSRTLLPDGRWLLMGGEGPQGPFATAAIFDPQTSTMTAVTQPLLQPRAWHTATLLADGGVLIAGGVGPGGQVSTVVEHFDPTTQAFHLVHAPGLVPRADQTATLLTDGRILFAGGVSPLGQVLADAQLFNPLTYAVEAVQSLSTPRRGATATLLPDGRVLLWGGADPAGSALTAGDVFDPQQSVFTRVTTRPATADPSDSPRLEASVPLSGSVDVPTGSLLALRFSKPLRVDPSTAATVTLSGPSGPAAATVVAAEGGGLVFVTPRAPLTPGATYAVTVNGAVDATGLLVPFTSVSFQTASPSTVMGSDVRVVAAPAPATSHFHPAGAIRPGTPGETDGDWTGDLCDGKPCSRWQRLPPLKAPSGVTALAGQMLRLNGEPLAQATLTIGTRSARTDATGRFLLTGIASGDQVLIMDGSTANRPGRSYGIFEYYVDIEDRQTTVLPFTIWMPLLDTRNATVIPVPTPGPIVGTTPKIRGLEVRIPGNVILQTSGGPLTSMPLTRIPVDRPPFPLPKGASFSFTPQAHGALVQRPDGTPNATGVRFILPNVDGLPPGTRVALQSYEPGKQWFVYGHGLVNADGTQIVPDAGVEFHRVTCYFTLGNPSNFNFLAAVLGGIRVADPVDIATGIFTMEKTDLVLPDVIPIVIKREYRQNDAVRRNGEYGTAQSFFYQMMLAGDFTTYTFAELVLGNGAKVYYQRTSAGTDKEAAVMAHTGSAQNPASPTSFYGSVLRWNAGRPGWDLTFKDGTVYQFAPLGHLGNPLTGVQDRVGNQLTVSRSGTHGEFIDRITSPNGRWVDFTNDLTNGVVQQIRDNLGRTVSYGYDAQFRLQTVTDAGGGVTTYTYHPQGAQYALIETIKDARQIVYLTNVWDLANRRVTRQTLADGGAYQFAYTVDGTGLITQTDVTDPRGYVRRVTFNASGYPLTDTQAFGTPEAQQTTYVRSVPNLPNSNLVSRVTDALNRNTDVTYDGLANVLTVTRYLNSAPITTTYTYEPTFNRVATIQDPLTHTTTFTYEPSGARNLQSISDPLSHQTSFTHDPQGQPQTITTPAGVTELGYDRGDLATVTDPLGKVTTRFTDASGRLISVTSPLGHRTRYEWDPLNQLTKTIDPLNGATQLTYDPNGNLTGVRDAKNNLTQYTPDSMDRVLTRTDALAHSASVLLYDENGNPRQVRDRKGQVTQTTFDPLNRPKVITSADASTTTLTWDAGNRLTQLVDSISGTITRSWDDLDRLTDEQTPQGRIDYTYDNAGRRQTMTVLGQPSVVYSWDNADRLQSLTQGSAVVFLGYDDANRRTSVTFPNGIVVTYAYNARDLTGITFTKGAATLGTLTYTTDADGRRIQVGGTWARTTLPPALTTATYNANNQQTKVGTKTLTYDLNGNLTKDGNNTYTWDARDRLTATNASRATFQYDPFGRRTRKVVGHTTTRFHYDGDNPVQELDGAGNIVANLLTGFGLDEFFTRSGSPGTRTLLADALGSTLALADDAGTVQTSYTYEPFGTSAVTGQSNTNSYQYTGRENDGTGLYYHRARYYSPSHQRFISEDPIEFRGGDVNLYSYALENPIQLVDSQGLDVTIAYYPTFATHVGIAVNDNPSVGFYPATGFYALLSPFGISVPGAVKQDTGTPAKIVRIKTTPEQDRIIQGAINVRANNPGRYNMYGRNCSLFVYDVLRVAGVLVPHTWLPEVIVNKMPNGIATQPR